jgi:hypothetical protein
MALMGVLPNWLVERDRGSIISIVMEAWKGVPES